MQINMELIKRFRWILFILIFFILATFVYSFYGYGFVKINDFPANSSVYLNHLYTEQNSNKIKLRPGSYVVDVSSPEYESKKSVLVVPFMSKTIDSKQTKRDFKQVVSELTYTNEENIDLLYGKLFSDQWYAGVVQSPTSIKYLIMYFSLGHWKIFYNGNDLGNEYLLVPEEIRQYLEQSDKTGMRGD